MAHSQLTRLITCLAVFRTQQTQRHVTHHCSLPQPHTTHRCPCGIQWDEGDGLIG